MNNFVLFGDVAEFRNGLNFSKDSHGKGCLLIGVSDFKDNFKPQYEKVDEINPDGVTKKEDFLAKGDLIFVRSNGNKALVGRSMYIDKDVKALYSGFCIRSRLKSDVIDPLFLAYYAKSDFFRKAISYADGTNINNLNQGILSDVKIPLLDLPIQKSIAETLEFIDKKIELNNKINAELEAMAKLIYDYWFVQFDFPSDSPQNKGKPYKSSGGKMVYNQVLKREIPDGWEVKKVKEFASTGSGGTPLKSKKEYYDNGNIPWINSGEVNAPFIIEAKKFITQLGVEKSSAKLFTSGTILMAMYGATAGKVSFINFEATTNQAICAINPHNENYNFYLKFGLEDLYNYLVNLSSGSARDNLSQDKIKELKFSIPTGEQLEKYHLKVQPMMDKVLSNMKENSELSELRDWLLPMLMNGQVTLKDA